ncbi:MAG: phosphatase domain-containing protein [Planctomycetaceae bacterium]
MSRSERNPKSRKQTVHEKETVLFYRGYGYYSPAGDCWHLRVHGRVYGPNRKFLRSRAMIFILSRYVRPERENGQHERFLKRAELFLHENRSGKSIPVMIGEQAFSLPDTSEHGHFETTLTMPASDLEGSTVTLPDGRRFLRFSVELPEDDGRVFAGDVELLQPTGVSVISDVDDTIKVTNTADRGELLRNTFAREFQAVDGMPTIYRRWADEGCSFHYVSASPWPLYEPLDQWLTTDGFPAGSLHLRYVGLRELSSDKRGEGSFRSKRASIEQILRAFPGRYFILCGDAGERDAELYGQIAQTFGNQIQHIFIRQVSGRHNPNGIDKREIEHLDPGRSDRWTIFEASEELGSVSSVMKPPN